ncbi:MAG: hypothetical protein KJZ78_19545 [Bryobacteraceae bacterium]|nr:hypothetical protein [Bryobacteraceae bacterium]HEU0142600.1 hypothetical protein [Bryobacteraceae bacterium]
MRFVFVSLCAIAGLFAPRAPAQSEIPPEWDTRKMLETFAGEVKKVKPVLDQVDPKKWTTEGASETYIAQWKSAQAHLEYLVGATEKLASNPERFPIALETYFRLESLETMINSLAQGIRRYDNPAVADLLQSTLAESQPYRQNLQRYMIDLAKVKEQEFRIADSEAQRCREALSRRPAGTQGKK